MMFALRTLRIVKGVLAGVGVVFVGLLLSTTLSGFTFGVPENSCTVCIECDLKKYDWAKSCCIGYDILFCDK